MCDVLSQSQNIKVRIKHYVDGYEELVDLHGFKLWNETNLKTDKPIFQVVGVAIGENYIKLLEANDEM